MADLRTGWGHQQAAVAAAASGSAETGAGKEPILLGRLRAPDVEEAPLPRNVNESALRFRRGAGTRVNCSGGTASARRWSRPQWRVRSRPQWRTTAGLLGCKSADLGFEAAAQCISWSRGRRRMRRCRHKPRRCSSVHLGKAVGKSTCALGILIARSLIATYANIHQRRGLRM